MSQQSIENLYQNHHRWLYRWLRSRHDNLMDAEDLAQDTFVRVIRSSNNMETVKDPRSYLVTIAKGLSIDLFRKRSLEQQYFEILANRPEAQWPSEEEHIQILEILVEIDTMLAGLGTKIRQAFILSQFEGLTYIQISEVLGVSIRTVKNYMAKATAHCCLYQLEQNL